MMVWIQMKTKRKRLWRKGFKVCKMHSAVLKMNLNRLRALCVMNFNLPLPHLDQQLNHLSWSAQVLHL